MTPAQKAANNRHYEKNKKQINRRKYESRIARGLITFKRKNLTEEEKADLREQKYEQQKIRAKKYREDNREAILEKEREMRRTESVQDKIYRRVYYRAKETGKEFTITKEDIVVPEFCPYLGIKLECAFGINGASPSSPTLDRIDSTKEYVPGNVQVISHRANCLKGTKTHAEFLEYIVKNKETLQPCIYEFRHHI